MPMQFLRLGLAAFLLLAAGVAANMILLQTTARVSLAGQAPQPGQGKSIARQRERQLALDVPNIISPSIAPRASATIKPEVITGDLATPDQGDTVRAIQRELHLRGYLTGSHDGVAGLVTRAAIMAFEHDNGLPLTAEPSEELLKRILLGPAAVPASSTPSKGPRGQSELVIRTVQQSLSGLGYNTGRADGRLGEDTLRAIRDFEADNAMPETGRVSGHLLARLTKLAGHGRSAANR
jgi:peptidoglycan hydrolase-like protein with peptidoglycan-binding domain